MPHQNSDKYRHPVMTIDFSKFSLNYYDLLEKFLCLIQCKHIFCIVCDIKVPLSPPFSIKKHNT